MINSSDEQSHRAFFTVCVLRVLQDVWRYSVVDLVNEITLNLETNNLEPARIFPAGGYAFVTIDSHVHFVRECKGTGRAVGRVAQVVAILVAISCFCCGCVWCVRRKLRE